MPSEASAARTFAINLVVNGGGEDGPSSTGGTVPSIPGWETSPGFTCVRYNAPGFLTSASPGPADRGQNFFAGGPNNVSSFASQVIDVGLGAAVIDNGVVTYALSAWLGGLQSQDDSMIVSLTFNDHEGESIATVTLPGPTSVQRMGQTGLLPRSRNGAVPVGTRTITVVLVSQRSFAPYNDGYADNISLVLTQPCEADFNYDGGVTIEDLLEFLFAFDEGSPDADIDDGSMTGTRDSGVTLDDLLYFLLRFDIGC